MPSRVSLSKPIEQLSFESVKKFEFSSTVNQTISDCCWGIPGRFLFLEQANKAWPVRKEIVKIRKSIDYIFFRFHFNFDVLTVITLSRAGHRRFRVSVNNKTDLRTLKRKRRFGCYELNVDFKTDTRYRHQTASS